MTRRYSDLEKKNSQDQAELVQVSALLDDANSLISTLNARLNSKEVVTELNFHLPFPAVYLMLA
jgi:hypothetical protein